MRLRTLPLALSGILTGGALSAYSGSMRWGVFGLAALTAVLLQILSNLANDLGDSLTGVDNADRVGPKRAVQQGLISKQRMKRGVAIVAVLALAAGLWFLYVASGGINKVFGGFVGVGVAAILAALGYTLGRKPYGYLGLGDVFVLLFFGLVAVLGSAFLISGLFYREWLLPAASMGCMAAAVLNLNNMRDIDNDRSHGKRTLAVRLGIRGAKLYHAGLIIIGFATMASFVFMTDSHGLWWVLLPYAIHFIHLKRVFSVSDSRQLDPELKKIALSAFLISLVFLIVTASA